MSEMTPDERTRQSVQSKLKTSLYVEAGAGSGKTSALVSRLSAIFTEGEATPTQVAAITFTRAAAFEMRSRVRAKLEEEIADAEDAEKIARLQEVIDSLDAAAIQTINSFALSLLRERPLAVGLPPVLDPMDEIQEGIDFDERWTDWLNARLDSDREFVSALGIAQRIGLARPLESLRALAWKLRDRYQLLEPGMFAFHGERPAGLDVAVVSDAADTVRELLRLAPDEDDTLATFASRTALPELERLIAEYGSGGTIPDIDLVDALSISPGGRSKGAKAKWRKAPGGLEAQERLTETLLGMQAQIDNVVDRLKAEILSTALTAVTEFSLQHAALRRRSGTVTFHDQLVLARDLLRQDTEALRLFRDRYRVILVDEFQDTDPLQVELLQLLSCLDSDRASAANTFLVGDPKQSIYRFRGADPAAARSLTDRVSEIGERLSLSENHRSQEPVLKWVNYVFSNWMGEQKDAGQASYEDLVWPGDAAANKPSIEQASVRWFGQLNEDSADATRRLEFTEISWIAQAAGRGAFTVRGDDGEERPSRYGDLAVLIKTRTGMDELEDQLINAGVPYVFEGQSPLFSSQDVRDLRSCLIAIDDPSDQVATLAALRTPAFSCSDPDLFTWKQAGGSFFYLDTAPEGVEGPVVHAFKELEKYHRLSRQVTVINLVERFIRERRLREKAVLSRTGPERLRRLNMVVELAASVSSERPVTLREFTTWMERQAEENARVPESVSEGTGADAVRVMTIHASKGLEFPIVALASARSTVGSRDSANIQVWRDDNGADKLDVQLGASGLGLRTDGYEDGTAQDNALGDLEDVRLLYVAATRAKDHLFVSKYRGSKENAKSVLVTRIEELMSDCPDELWVQWEGAPGLPVAPAVEPGTPDTAQDRQTWQEARRRLIEEASRRGYVTPTGLKADSAKFEPLPKEPSDTFDGEPGRFGRGAAERGRAVHGLLQHISLTSWTDDDIDRMAGQMADSHGVPELKDEIAIFARGALTTDVLQAAARAAARGRAWREVSIAAPVDDAEGALEGQIDLLFEDYNGDLIVVDYKTDRVPGDDMAEASEPYLLQMGAYAWAVERLTGKRVKRAVLVFTRLASTDQPAEYPVPDLEILKAEAARKARESLSAVRSGS